MVAPTSRPWSVVELDGSLWIAGAPGSAASENLPGDTSVVCDFDLIGDEEHDAVTRANADHIVAVVNEAGDAA